MKRRDFLRSTGIVSASLMFPNAGRTFVEGATSGSWRTFEVTTRVEVLKPSGVTRRGVSHWPQLGTGRSRRRA